MDKDRDDDYVSGTNDSASSSDTRVHEPKSQPFVLELHDIRKDDPMIADAQPNAKKKLKKKKKGQPVREKSSSSSGLSEISSDISSEDLSSTVTVNEDKEEFYDAHESYYALPGQGLLKSTTKTIAYSETSHNPKSTTRFMASSDQTTTSSRKEPSTLTKPSHPPD